MTAARVDTVVVGEVVVAAERGRLETAGGLAIAEGRVAAIGERDEMLALAGSATAVIRADHSAVVPGLHDFHLHLVGMARARRTVDLTGARTMDRIVELVRSAAEAAPVGEWVRGDGWWTEALDPAALQRLEQVLAGRPAFFKSHDRHSAWASAEALQRAGIEPNPADPEGGRFERGEDGSLNGILRERAADLVGDHAGRLTGAALASALDEVAGELLALGFTGATDAGDATDANGVGPFAGLGDSFSSLAEAASVFEGRLRVTLDLPAAALDVAARAGLRTGARMHDSVTLRVGWVKVYADGALGSRTAAVFAPYRCMGDGDPLPPSSDATGILRVSHDQLGAVVSRARAAGLGLAIHAIGDRAAAMAVDALAGASPPAVGAPPDRIEHLQLVRARERAQMASLDVTASVQPLHCPSDRSTAEACWPDRLADAYPWRSLSNAGARLAFGSDAPIEPVNPWLAIYAAVHRRLPGDPAPDWRADEALDPVTALGAYTLGPAQGLGARDLGHLRIGAHADLAILDTDRATLLAGDERIADIRSILTITGGRVVHGR